LIRRELELAERGLGRVYRERGEVDLVAHQHGHVLHDRLQELQVALDLGHEPAATHVLQVDIDSAARLADGIREAATAPRLDLDELSLLAVDGIGHAGLHLLGGLGVHVRAKDVDGFVLFVPDDALRAGDRSRRGDIHFGILQGSSPKGRGPVGRNAHEQGSA